MKRTLRVAFLVFLVFLVTTACNLLDSLKASVVKDTPAQVEYLLRDDFSNPQSGWEIYSGEYGTAGYDQNGYVVESLVENEYNWGAAGVNFGDVRIEVDATVLQTVEGGDDAFGIDCRLQENGDAYGFRITSDGYAGISKYSNTESSALVDWFTTDVIKTDGTVNHLTAICNGNNLQLLVNGVSVAQTTDDTYTSGDIAFSVVGLQSGVVSVLFDNVLVQKP